MVLIGSEERIDFVDVGIFKVPAKIDSGAQSCSVWASNIQVKNGELIFTLFGEQSKHYNGEQLSTNKYKKVIIRNSFGHTENRFKTKLRININSQKHYIEFTLSDRSTNKYPVLIGKNLLRNRYRIDVSKKNMHFGESRAKIQED